MVSREPLYSYPEFVELETERNELKRQLAEARERIAELEKDLERSTVHRISLLPTYPEGVSNVDRSYE